MSDQIRDAASQDDPTEAEIEALRAAGLPPDREDTMWDGTAQMWLNDYSGSSLLAAFRAGYALGKARSGD
jgi:hypothetical protein